MNVRRILLARRRFDAVLLAAGFAALAAMLSVGKVVFILFAVCGIYLAAIRHRTMRHWSPAFAAALSAWALWQIGLSLLRGEPIAGNRVLSYAGLELALVFLPLGFCLVRRPLDALATGARLGLLVLLVATPIQFALIGGRVGLGVNEAIFAFVAGIVGLAARLPARRPLRFLPDGRLWTYLATVPIVLSGTRAALVLMLMTAALDLYTLFALRRRTRRQTWTLLGAIGAIVVLCAYPVATLVGDRFEAGLVELENFEATGQVTGSADVRLVMWRAAASVLAEHPLLGVGGTERMQRVAEKAGGNAYMVTWYEHLHNFFFDEALSSGLVGVALLLSVFLAFLVTVFRSRAGRLERETACVLVAFLFLFGSFHGVLLNEWTLIVVFGTMSALLTKLRRETLAGRSAPNRMAAAAGGDP